MPVSEQRSEDAELSSLFTYRRKLGAGFYLRRQAFPTVVREVASMHEMSGGNVSGTMTGDRID
jgi:hypothetical protein